MFQFVLIFKQSFNQKLQKYLLSCGCQPLGKTRFEKGTQSYLCYAVSQNDFMFILVLNIIKRGLDFSLIIIVFLNPILLIISYANRIVLYSIHPTFKDKRHNQRDISIKWRFLNGIK